MTPQGTIDDPLALDFALGMVLPPGSKIIMLPGVYDGYFQTWQSSSSESEPLLLKANGNKINGTLGILGSNMYVYDLIINDDSFCERISEEEGSAPTDIPSHIGLRLDGINTHAQDCIISNATGGGISPDESTAVFDGCIIYYTGWDAPDRPHGHGIYAQKNVIIRNCIIFSNFSYGVHIYGEGDQSIDNVLVENTVSFCNGSIAGSTHAKSNLLTGKPSGVFANPQWKNNCTYHLPTRTIENQFGYGSSTFTDGVMTGNYMPDGVTITGGTPTNSGNVTAPEETNFIKVYEVRGRAHVAIYNWELFESVVVDVSSVFGVGETVNAHNVQDYFVDIQELTVAGDGTITVNMQAANRTVATPQGWTAPATTFPTFGCFVLEAA